MFTRYFLLIFAFNHLLLIYATPRVFNLRGNSNENDNGDQTHFSGLFLRVKLKNFSIFEIFSIFLFNLVFNYILIFNFRFLKLINVFKQLNNPKMFLCKILKH